MRDIRLYGTTNGSGALTVQSSESVNGVVYAVQEIDGTFDDGVDLTLTCEHPDYSMPLLVHANFNADGLIYPRVLKNLGTDGSAITGQYDMPIVVGRLKMVIAQGGDTKAGGVHVYVMEL